MPEYTRDEALAFINAMRLTLQGKVGFKWLLERLDGLTAYVESVTAENEQLNAYLDQAGARDEYEAFRAAHTREPADAEPASDAPPRDDWPRGLSAPARRALANAGYVNLEQLTAARASDLRQLHGMGPKALGLLRSALAEQGESFSDEGRETGRSGEPDRPVEP